MAEITLTPEERQLQLDAATYASKYLTNAINIHSKHVWPRHTHQRERFELTRPLYRTAVQYGLLKAQIPKRYGGAQDSATDAAVVFEEMYAVDSSITLTLAATGLGLSPLILGGSPDQCRQFLSPFLAGKNEPLASLMLSEPGGTAGWLTEGSAGLQTTARREGNYWVVNGIKEGALNSGGWDRRGADLQCLVCRVVGTPLTNISTSLRESVIVLLLTRDLIAQQPKEAYQILSETELSAHPAVSGPRTRFRNLRVPVGPHVLAGPESGAALVETCLARHVALTASFSVSVMKHALSACRRFTNSESRGGTTKLQHIGGVSSALSSTQKRVDVSRSQARRALQQVSEATNGASQDPVGSYTAMLTTRQEAIGIVADSMSLVGPAAFRAEQPFTQWLLTAASTPLVDDGVWMLENGQAKRLDESLRGQMESLSLK